MAKMQYVPTQQPITRKITNIGNSLGVTLPTDFINSLNLSKGEHLDVFLEDDVIILKKTPPRPPSQEIDDDLLKLIFEEMEAHDEALKGLAKR